MNLERLRNTIKKAIGLELCRSGRYAHSKTYVAGRLAVLRYTVNTLRPCVTRRETGEDVKGWMVVARKTN